MVFAWVAEDQNVIHIRNSDEIKQTHQGFINIGLKGCRCIRQPKRHNHILKVSVSRAKRSLPFVSFLDTNLMVRVLEVQLRKDSCPGQTINSLADQWQRMSVLHRDTVKRTIIDT